MRFHESLYSPNDIQKDNPKRREIMLAVAESISNYAVDDASCALPSGRVPPPPHKALCARAGYGGGSNSSSAQDPWTI